MYTANEIESHPKRFVSLTRLLNEAKISYSYFNYFARKLYKHQLDTTVMVY